MYFAFVNCVLFINSSKVNACFSIVLHTLTNNNESSSLKRPSFIVILSPCVREKKLMHISSPLTLYYKPFSTSLKFHFPFLSISISSFPIRSSSHENTCITKPSLTDEVKYITTF